MFPLILSFEIREADRHLQNSALQSYPFSFCLRGGKIRLFKELSDDILKVFGYTALGS